YVPGIASDCSWRLAATSPAFAGLTVKAQAGSSECDDRTFVRVRTTEHFQELHHLLEGRSECSHVRTLFRSGRSSPVPAKVEKQIGRVYYFSSICLSTRVRK